MEIVGAENRLKENGVLAMGGVKENERHSYICTVVC